MKNEYVYLMDILGDRLEEQLGRSVNTEVRTVLANNAVTEDGWGTYTPWYILKLELDEL